MKRQLVGLIVLILCCLLFSFNNRYHTKSIQNQSIEWLPADLIKQKNAKIKKVGNPKIVNCKFGKALYFNGESDGLFLDEMPLLGLTEFTVEMIFYPEANSPFEQRIIHIGEVTGNRIFAELRAVGYNWYFDGFVASNLNKKALIDEQLIHPIGQWYHVAFVVCPERLTTFVNRKEELSEPIFFEPLETGCTSIGVRQNKQSWFKGMIYKIKITPKQLYPDEFITE